MTNLNSRTKTRIDKILSNITDLKPLPTTVTKTIRLLEEPDTSAHEIASIILMDQALTARLLKLVNSPYYHFTYPATTVHEAVTRLGFRRMKSLLFTLSYSSALGKRVASYKLGHGELWRHSVAIAMIAQWLSDRVGYQAPDEAYIGGLLHDIGKLILDQHFRLDWSCLLNEGQMRQLTLLETEESLFHLNHALVGAELARQWKLPDCLVETIRYHHTPASAKQSPVLTAIVHTADIICLRLGIGLSHPTFLPLPSVEALELLALGDGEVDLLVEGYRDNLEANLRTDTELISA